MIYYTVNCIDQRNIQSPNLSNMNIPHGRRCLYRRNMIFKNELNKEGKKIEKMLSSVKQNQLAHDFTLSPFYICVRTYEIVKVTASLTFSAIHRYS